MNLNFKTFPRLWCASQLGTSSATMWRFWRPEKRLTTFPPNINFLNFQPITAMCALPTQQSTFLATGCRGGSIKLWDVGSSLKMRPLETVIKSFFFCNFWKKIFRLRRHTIWTPKSRHCAQTRGCCSAPTMRTNPWFSGTLHCRNKWHTQKCDSWLFPHIIPFFDCGLKFFLPFNLLLFYCIWTSDPYQQLLYFPIVELFQ